MKKLWFILLLLLNGMVVSAQTLLGGAASRVITPDPLLPVSGGVGIPKAALENKGDLFVRAMVLQQGETKVALVGIDNLGWPAVLGDQARALISDIHPQNILIGATHTHSAPDAYGFPDETGKSHADMGYLNWCTEQIAEAVNEALANLEPVDLKVAYGEVTKGISYNYYAPELYDPNCGVIQLISKKSGKALGTLVNYAVHPEVIGSKRGILSPDLCGPLYQTIEEAGGGVAVFFNGAQGGMVTADNRRADGEDNTWEECVRIGNLLGNEALRLVNSVETVQNPQLEISARTIQFPIDSDIMKMVLKYSPLGYTTTEDFKVNTIQNLISIGPAKMLTIPGEALPNIGYYLKRKMNSEYPFLLGLTNDAFGYILTKVDFNSFKRYDYVSKTSLGEYTGEILIEESIKHINNEK